MRAWNRVNRHNPCPICQHAEGCEVSADGAVCVCRRESAAAFREMKNGAGWMHRLKDGPDIDRPAPLPLPIERPKAAPDTLNRVYTALLSHLDLSPEHLAHLVGPQRQFSRNQIKHRGYRSLPGRGRSAICRDMAERFGAERLLSVPGFYVSSRGPGPGYITLAGPVGLLIPFRDVDGHIVGLQIRPDGKQEGSPKYVWLSARGKPGGIGPGGDDGLPTHVARPRTEKGRRVWITEGPIKADIAADLLGEVVIAVPGVSTWEGAHVPNIVEALNPEAVVVAYDADAERKTQVKAARRALACALAAAGHRVFVARWNEVEGKSLDDLLLSGGAPVPEPWIDTGEARVVKVPASVVKAQKKLTAPATLDEAHEGHRREIERRIVRARPGDALFVLSAPGTGKGHAVFASLERLCRGTWPTVIGTRRRKSKLYKGPAPLRVLFAVDTREQIEKVLSDYPWLTEARDVWGYVAVRVGRDAASCREDLLDQVNAYGNARHSVSINVCDGCPLRHVPCRYWQSVADADKARIVLATKAAVFNGGQELSTFDVVVVDENLTRCLFEDGVTLDLVRLTEWTGQMNRIRDLDPDAYTDHHPHRRLVSLLAATITHAPTEEPAPLVPELRRIAGGGEVLADLVQQAAQIRPGDKTGRYDFEEPVAEVVPLRFMADLLRLLSEEIDRPEGADTRLWVSTKGIEPYLFRGDVADVLRGRTLINLDATPFPVWTRFFPGAEPVRYDVPEDIEVVQVTDYTLTKRTLERPGARARVNAALEAITKDAERPAVFCHKALNPEVQGNAGKDTVFQLSNPNVTWGHFGKDTRAFNNPEVMRADVLVIVGFYCHPPWKARALAQAVRNSADPVTKLGRESALKPYANIGPDGKGTARRVRSDPDPLVQELIDTQVSADILQAIGRARACLRKEGPPLRVYILTAYPVTGLKVDRLTTLEEFVGPVPPPAHLAEMNRQRAEEARRRIEKAVQELQAEGLPVSFRTVRERTGTGSKTTILEVLSGFYGGRYTHVDKYNRVLTQPVCTTNGKNPEKGLEKPEKPYETRAFEGFDNDTAKNTLPDAPVPLKVPEVILSDDFLEVRI